MQGISDIRFSKSNPQIIAKPLKKKCDLRIDCRLILKVYIEGVRGWKLPADAPTPLICILDPSLFFNFTLITHSPRRPLHLSDVIVISAVVWVSLGALVSFSFFLLFSSAVGFSGGMRRCKKLGTIRLLPLILNIWKNKNVACFVSLDSFNYCVCCKCNCVSDCVRVCVCVAFPVGSGS